MDQREGVAVAVLKAAGLDIDAISEAASAEIKKLPKASGASVQNSKLQPQRPRRYSEWADPRSEIR